jgi:hypothetical protein
MRVQDQDKSNCDLAYMASFCRKNQLVETKKNSLKESSWFGEPKCKLGLKVVHSFVFFFVLLFSLLFFTLVVQIMWEWKTCYKLRTLLRAHQLLHFLPILKLTWMVLWILTRWFSNVVQYLFITMQRGYSNVVQFLFFAMQLLVQ